VCITGSDSEERLLRGIFSEIKILQLRMSNLPLSCGSDSRSLCAAVDASDNIHVLTEGRGRFFLDVPFYRTQFKGCWFTLQFLAV
jgi:hypothetical protein